MADREEQHHQHIVMLSFMAQGHLIPFLALANQIHRRFGFTITIATTPLNVRHLAGVVAKNPTPSSGIHLFELPLNTSDHGLPPNAENTESLPLNLVVNLFHSSTSLEPPFRALIQNITADQNGTAAYVSLWQHLPHHRRTADDEFNLPGFPDSCVFHITQLHSFLRAADGTDSWSRFFQPQIENSMNSFG
ncbi:PREDICTED: crocetin glucosyltransferase 3-like [Erythranthe guttata]|nr:PREDICTED: crocetin glucosyltransferase 3-like [Erythranthe guttata]|eukprot:XP_012841294.1 PREDICTED: crocetin glucosyltransferase 3-like [Erythranthe guttata]